MLNFEENFYFNDTLKEVVKDEKLVLRQVNKVNTSLSELSDFKDRVRALGELGFLHRVLGELDKAEGFLIECLKLVEEHDLGDRFYVTYGIRLSHVWQWKKQFHKSSPMFERIIHICKTEAGCEELLDFAYQHSGKNYFDQAKYEEALKLLYKALLIRNKKNDSSLVASTLFAIEKAKERGFSQVMEEHTAKIKESVRLPGFIKEFLGKDHLTDSKQSNCMRGALNCFTKDYSFDLCSPMEFIDQLKTNFEQLDKDQGLVLGDMVVFWTREPEGAWEDKEIRVSKIDSSDKEFPYGIIFDHVGVYILDDIMFNKPNPSKDSKYRFDFIQTAMIPAKLAHGFEVTYHRSKRALNI